MSESERVKIGIAMIARNAEKLMPLALDPLVEHVDEVAIVLGGISSDKTPGLAVAYATLPVEEYAGPVDDDGRLMNFAAARNQSFDILRRAGLNYAFVVDTDDQWTNAQNLQHVLDQMLHGGFPMVLFPYDYDGGTFMQPRIYRMDSGHWESPCHNYWEIDVGQRVALQTDLMRVVQERPAEKGKDRREQNTTISETWMEEHGDDCRLLLHMAKDYLVDRKIDEADDALDRYFIKYAHDQRQDPEELYNAHQAQAGICMLRGDYAEALFAALRALAVRSHGQSWSIASEAAGWMSRHSQSERPLMQLAAFCADQAIATGKPRGNLHWHSEKLSGVMPLFLKARALAGLGRLREARGALDLALQLEPGDSDLQAFRRDVCRMLGELE